ncbi:hypothetical protein [Streptomyces sp. NPDC005385]|uniref:hypothetical protein n=1 Tax=Streptomyces sp. NPDC005385 TaxID=3157039 RepID=UPI0033BF2541
MAIFVMSELSKFMSEDFGQGDAHPQIKKVHAAPADGSIPGAPGDRTLCGKPTAAMERSDYSPPEPGSPWLPPSMRPWTCHQCDAALQAP